MRAEGRVLGWCVALCVSSNTCAALYGGRRAATAYRAYSIGACLPAITSFLPAHARSQDDAEDRGVSSLSAVSAALCGLLCGQAPEAPSSAAEAPSRAQTA